MSKDPVKFAESNWTNSRGRTFTTSPAASLLVQTIGKGELRMRKLSEARAVAVEVIGQAMVQWLEARGLVVVDAAYHDRMKVALQEVAEVYRQWWEAESDGEDAMESVGDVLQAAEESLGGDRAGE